MRLELYTNTCKTDNCFFATLNYVRFAFIIDIHVGSSTGAVLRTVPVPGISKGVLKLVMIDVHRNKFLLGAMHAQTHLPVICICLLAVLSTTAEDFRLKFRGNVYHILILVAAFTIPIGSRHSTRWSHPARIFIYVIARRPGLAFTPGMPPRPATALYAIAIPVMATL